MNKIGLNSKLLAIQVFFFQPLYPVFQALLDGATIPCCSAIKATKTVILKSSGSGIAKLIVLNRNRDHPPPAESPDVSENLSRAARTLDQLFEDWIDAFPIEVQQNLQEMWSGVRVEPVEGLLEMNRSYGIWEIRNSDLGLEWFVQIDADIAKTKIIRQTLLMSQLVHVAQSQERIIQVGPEKFIEEHESGGFSKFTKLSASVLEKLILESIPESAIRQDAAALPDQDWVPTVTGDMLHRRNLELDTAINESPVGLTPKEATAFKGKLKEIFGGSIMIEIE